MRNNHDILGTYTSRHGRAGRPCAESEEGDMAGNYSPSGTQRCSCPGVQKQCTCGHGNWTSLTSGHTSWMQEEENLKNSSHHNLGACSLAASLRIESSNKSQSHPILDSYEQCLKWGGVKSPEWNPEDPTLASPNLNHAPREQAHTHSSEADKTVPASLWLHCHSSTVYGFSLRTSKKAKC